ncbi:hypothetical protein DSM106972_008130 [Dulcicalothrix desertica PCC 7102]|uniref:Uncharacterized protein n=1 Tax=Dulcicalothrix desertica PCC 7102 TaxID=232991 RepID=A0A3S1BER6_9CYAN|nr:hypothetical protein [Dulcicalothrix desertica]RUT10318.1 hypothetical protein DSM106972_008130 [Dulcicalothrix desertica PCC 7102]TWH40710.1 hypothetical protein CAL7102_10062 [Dulcicalothrix desertica PCC 7102]
MQSIKINSYIGSDGILHINVPVGLTNQNVEVMLMYQPVESDDNGNKGQTLDELGWSLNFFEKRFGAWQGEPLVREPQGKPQERNWDDLFT